jgi:hypothetical protein
LSGHNFDTLNDTGLGTGTGLCWASDTDILCKNAKGQKENQSDKEAVHGVKYK